MKKVALVLSSGGARGIAHIGVIESLEEHGYEITSIAGTSMGSLVGGMYAAGKLKEYKEWMLSLNKRKIYELTDFDLSLTHVISVDKVIDELKRIAGKQIIENLRIPYTAIATDMQNGHEVVFNHGDMYKAIQSSISIPILFCPAESNEHKIVDGGLSNPLPLNRVKRTEGDILVASNVCGKILANPPRRQKQPHYNIPLVPYGLSTKIQKTGMKWIKNNYFSIMSDISDIMIYHNAERSKLIYTPDICVEISSNLFSGFAYDHAETIIKYGKAQMDKILNRKEIANI